MVENTEFDNEHGDDAANKFGIQLDEVGDQFADVFARLDVITEILSTNGVPSPFFAITVTDDNENIIRRTKISLPDPRLVRHILKQRQLRQRFFKGDLFADPAWDMLLDLTAARAEHIRVSVTSLCIASGVPATTALRWITHLVEAGLVERTEDATDRRRAFVRLTDRGADTIARYFLELGRNAERLI